MMAARVNFELDKAINDELNSLLPRGTKSMVLRGFVCKLIKELRAGKMDLVNECSRLSQRKP
jgi:hypothetical protein